MGGLCSSCFGASAEEREEEAAKIAQAKAMAGQAAQLRAENFQKSAAGRAAHAQAAKVAKPSPPASKGEPTLKWQMG